ncbi:methyltransferase family protein [Hyphococcus sp.]|uniref:methyltransferase family protein n=1 Tax=Hyphococcus sp. TaxID=2038636 RepID=UPI00208B352C|nr:MAG: membrane protein [Marinicaulis sp.]
MRTLIPPPLHGLLVGLLMWLVNRYFPFSELAFPGRTPLAIVFIVLGGLIEVAALATFVKRKTTINPVVPSNASVLVTDGLFQFSRNPMYLALLLVLIGWALWLGSPVNAALLVGFIWFLTEFQIKPEEDALREKFGENYTQYCRETRRWI